MRKYSYLATCFIIFHFASCSHSGDTFALVCNCDYCHLEKTAIKCSGVSLLPCILTVNEHVTKLAILRSPSLLAILHIADGE